MGFRARVRTGFTDNGYRALQSLCITIATFHPGLGDRCDGSVAAGDKYLGRQATCLASSSQPTGAVTVTVAASS